MQKKLIALAVAGLMSSAAFAESSVTVYGSLDATYATITNDSVGVGMNDVTHKTSRLGFKGSEKLGNGMTAFFQLEERFKLDTATADGSLRWKDKSWVGLQGGFGKVSFGRIPTALDIIYGGGKAGNQDTIADWNGRKAKAITRFDNGVSYTSPKLGGMVTINAATTSGDQAKERGVGTDGDLHRPYDISTNVSFGKAFVEAGYQNGGSQNYYKSVIVNGGYKFGFMNLYASMVQSNGFDKRNTGNKNAKYQQFEVAADFKAGASGLVAVTLGHSWGKDSSGKYKPSNGGSSEKAYNKLGVAYIHSLSKNVKLLAATSYAKQDKAFNGKDNQVGLQAGLRVGF